VTAGEESGLVAGFYLPRDYRIRLPYGPAFVAGSIQAFIGDFRPKLFQRPVVALCVCLSASSAIQGI
jgi:hypothetical protein